ncbi:DUF2007 domain-containing protein [Nevskia sp.]|uniref:putative signal transducing protein n=1 Tax=Nevskia sp. TaxID=1929292 RepID=UPI0025FB4EA1|nr:DUF2007 domain-containing protein [Nevskia sp.]
MGNAPDDWLTVARLNDAVEAQLLQGRLQADGIEAQLADQNHVQADPLIAIALGGVRVQVRRRDAAVAQSIIEALASGDYALDDDFDPGASVD